MSASAKKINKPESERINKILDVIMAYARLDFSKKTDVEGTEDALDALGAGVNMLGEELENSTISLKEKEQMIKEIHHRVKNNLQIVSSLLNLQTENIYDPSFLNMVIASRNRINSMALVHEMLYTSTDLRKVEVSEYVYRLCQNIHISLAKPNSNIEFLYNIKPNFFLDIDRMIPVGLILNEIITNSLKYAFPNNTGKISIDFSQTNKTDNTIIVSDNGIGLPKRFNVEKDSNLGLQLITMLTRQLGGKLEIERKNGTNYTIKFN